MDVKLLCQFRQRQLAPDGGQCHLRLECRGVVPARSSAHVLSCSAAILAAGRQKLQLPRCPNSPGQLSLCEANPDEAVTRPDAFTLRGELQLKIGKRELAEADFGHCSNGAKIDH